MPAYTYSPLTRTVTIGYSDNGGGSWISTSFTVSNYSLVELVRELKRREYARGRRLEPIYRSRYRLRFTLDRNQFSVAADGTDAKWIAVQLWQGKKLKRVTINGTVDGLTTFSTPVVVALEGEPDQLEEDYRQGRSLNVSVVTAQGY